MALRHPGGDVRFHVDDVGLRAEAALVGNAVNHPAIGIGDARFRARLYDTSGQKDRFELTCTAVTKALIHAVEARRPRARYYVTLPTYIAGLARRILPTRALDWLVR